MNKKIKTRIAPSPTGLLHIGNLRTALYNYLFAKQNDGEFMLRVEDTGQARFVEGAMEKVLEMLSWSEINWDGDIILQSNRLPIYQKYAKQLIEEDKAYYCFCPAERLEKMRQKQQEKKLAPRYDGTCKSLTNDEIENNLRENKKYVVRLKVPKDEIIEFDDLVYGKISYSSNDIDDQVLIKSDGFPTYHLAVVIDDHEMAITHIMRGEDWLPSTPKHVLLYKAFGWEMPEFIHLPNILGENKKKLSKRTGDVSVEEFKNKGYLPQALVNYISLLGWNPGTEQEIFSLAELIKIFDVKKIHKAGAIFDYKKLNNINGQYIRKLAVKDLKNLCLPYLEKVYDLKNYQKEYIEKVIAVEQDRLKIISDIVENTKLFFTDDLQYDRELLIWKKSDLAGAKKSLELFFDFLTGNWDEDSLENTVLAFIKESNLTNGEVLWPLRVALSGQNSSPGPFEIMSVLKKEKTLARIKKAIQKLEA